MIHNAIPNVGTAEGEAVLEAVETGMLAIGPAIGALESRMSERMGGIHAVAVQTGTAALHLALLASGVGDQDLVIVPEATFVATVNAVCYCGAAPLLADIDPKTGLLDINGLQTFLQNECDTADNITTERTTGKIIKAIVPVHLYGHPVDMNTLDEALKPYGIAVVEDAAEALGAQYRDRPVGGLGHTAILSFNGNKIITGGAGGMVLTPDPEIATRVRYLASQARNDAVYFAHNEIGFNYRMPNLNAALILAQLDRLDAFVARKREVAKRYGALFANIPGVAMMRESTWAESSCWMSLLSLDLETYASGAERIIRELVARQIGARPAWIPLGDLPPHKQARRINGQGAQRFLDTIICLPCSTGITDDEVETVAAAVRDVLSAARA
jgi:perosamine synthetase